VQEVGTALKAGLFMLLIVALLLAPRGAPTAAITTPEGAAAVTVGGVIVAIRAIFGAYSGWNCCAYFCEEVRNPGSAIARGTFTGIVVVTVIYVLANIAYLAVLSPAEMAGSNLVAADAAAKVFGSSGGAIVTAVSLVSLVTVLNSVIMVYPRVAFGVGRDYGIPLLDRVAKNGTPQGALIATVVAGALLATAGVYEILLAFSMSLQVAMQMSVNAAALVMRRREPGLERPWKMPLFPLPALFALAVNTALFLAFVSEAPVTAAQAFALLGVLTGLAWLATRRGARSEAQAPKA
jgi:APA family basic amino acid/polyamine antiporter